MSAAPSEFRQKDDPPPATGLAEDLGAVTQQFDRVVRLAIDRFRLDLRRRVERWVWYVGVAAVGVVIAATGAFHLVRGTSAALAQALGGRSWAGDLASGGLFLAVALTIMAVLQRRRRREDLSRLRKKYDEQPATWPPSRGGQPS